MARLTKKTPVTPTHEERIAEAESLKTGALDVFEQAIRDLELAEALHANVYEDIEAEIQRLIDLQWQADNNADKAGAKAHALRQLIGA